MKWMAGVLLTLCFGVIAPANAQVRWGVKGGMNVSKLISSSDLFKGDNKTGWFIGPMAEFKLPLLGMGIDAAALYSQSKGGIEGTYQEVSLKSVEIPINLKWSFGTGMAGAYIAAGPQFGFNVGKKEQYSWDLKKGYTTFNVGAGVKLLNHLQVGANYNFALGKTGTYAYRGADPTTGSVDYENVRNNTWQVSAAYLF